MIKIKYTPKFKRAFKKLQRNIAKQANKQMTLFQVNPKYPSLNTEKLEPKSDRIWSFRVNDNYPIFFKYINNNTAELQNIGKHDYYKKL